MVEFKFFLIQYVSHFAFKEGFAKCYEITDTKTGNVYAGKIVSKRLMTKHNQKEKLTQEIAIHRSLNHKNVVGFHGFFEDSQNVYIVLELCRRRVCTLILLDFIFLYMHFYLINFYFSEKTKYVFMSREKMQEKITT
jgi:serine/threonine protein kinase